MSDQPNYIVVQVSANRWVVAERDAGWSSPQFKACSRKMERKYAVAMRDALETTNIEDYPEWVSQAIVEL